MKIDTCQNCYKDNNILINPIVSDYRLIEAELQCTNCNYQDFWGYGNFKSSSERNNSWNYYVDYCVSVWPEKFASETYSISEQIVANYTFSNTDNNMNWKLNENNKYYLTNNNINFQKVRYSPSLFIGAIWWIDIFDRVNFIKPSSNTLVKSSHNSNFTINEYSNRVTVLNDCPNISIIDHAWKLAIIKAGGYLE